ncbi:MAG: MBL fold metallo-hydrolase [Desulfobacteraceae bacterium]|nr:MAG: MBL fold metallo-hydrolase [Desulfobacteraceae bacterium]
MQTIIMKKIFYNSFWMAAMIVPVLLAGCSSFKTQPDTIAANPDLAAHSSEFRQEVMEVADGVHVAIGFGLANSILIEGDDGVIIVDTMECAEAAVPVKAAFDSITSKPVKAIIYTHFHSDHTFGATVMAGNDHPEIYAHQTTRHHLDRIVNITRDTTYRRAMRQFGVLLPPGGLVNAGVGSRLLFDQHSTPGLLYPTKTYDDRMELEIAGVRLVLIHAPGETPDQTIVWLPDKDALLCADNYYKSFPNLYAIRGTAYRDVTLWVKSLDIMRDLRPNHLVPGHTRPLEGEAIILETLTNYRDAIQFVHDQTIRHINAGLTPEEIVGKVKLPPHLAYQPYLQEYYGTVEWSVKAIFNGYLGWFGGNATDLFPLQPKERAKRFTALAGGRENLLKAADAAFETGDCQWALELADQLLILDPDMPEAVSLRAASLECLGEKQITATARNYYLTQSLEAENKLTIGKASVNHPEFLHSIPVAAIFNAMAVNLNPEKSADVDQVIGFRFPDTDEAYTVHVRRGVAEIQPRFPQNPDITVTVNSNIWKEIAAGLRNPAVAIIRDLEVEGGTINLIRFLTLFK